MDQKMDELSNNIMDSDSESLYRTAHAIKSMSANIGAEKVRFISAHIEDNGKSESIVGIEDLVPLLTDNYREFVQEFRSELID
jgi:HPt (histidine-containing phosphotransfer) domain-containing protein